MTAQTIREHLPSRRKRHLIINADGYGMTPGVTRAIEECVEFGTVRSLSTNINFSDAEKLRNLVHRFPDLSVGCHINPVVGPPVLAPNKVGSLLGQDGHFLYKNFARRFLQGRIRIDELRAEMNAQVDKTRQIAGSAFTHVDFHMGLHRLPVLYELFLEVAERSGTGRIRTHRYRTAMESQHPRLSHFLTLFQRPLAAPTFAWNTLLRRKAKARGFAMPDNRVAIYRLGFKDETITLANYIRLLNNLPSGFSELTAHPGYVDDELKRWSTYLHPRRNELEILTNPEFRNALLAANVHLAGYADIPTTFHFARNAVA